MLIAGFEQAQLRAVRTGEFAGDIQVEARAFAGARGVGAEEALEEARLRFGRDAGAGVGDREFGMSVAGRERDFHKTVWVVVFHRIAQQVLKNVAHQRAVGVDVKAGLDVMFAAKAGVFANGVGIFHETREVEAEIVALAREREFSGVGLREQEQTVRDTFGADSSWRDALGVW